MSKHRQLKTRGESRRTVSRVAQLNPKPIDKNDRSRRHEGQGGRAGIDGAAGPRGREEEGVKGAEKSWKYCCTLVALFSNGSGKTYSGNLDLPSSEG